MVGKMKVSDVVKGVGLASATGDSVPPVVYLASDGELYWRKESAQALGLGIVRAYGLTDELGDVTRESVRKALKDLDPWWERNYSEQA